MKSVGASCSKEHCLELLAQLDFRADPAGELIAATRVAHGVPLLTRDRALLAPNIVPLAL